MYLYIMYLYIKINFLLTCVLLCLLVLIYTAPYRVINF